MSGKPIKCIGCRRVFPNQYAFDLHVITTRPMTGGHCGSNAELKERQILFVQESK